MIETAISWAHAHPLRATAVVAFVLYLTAIVVILVVVTRGASDTHQEPM